MVSRKTQIKASQEIYARAQDIQEEFELSDADMIEIIGLVAGGFDIASKREKSDH